MQENLKRNLPIGFFDSGIGGLTVLKEAIKLMPNENYIYFGDSLNAPYGVKSIDMIKNLSFEASSFLVSKGIKALVVACNTATSAAIDDLRSRYPHMPVIGIEPALKPALNLSRKGNILIMATPVTLKEKKFNNLLNSLNIESSVIPVPCPGLAELIEEGNVSGSAVRTYLYEALKLFQTDPIASVVLGCTHYPFIKEELTQIIGNNIPIIDGSLGTANQLKRKLIDYDLLSLSPHSGKIEIFNSLPDTSMVELSYKLLN